MNRRKMRAGLIFVMCVLMAGSVYGQSGRGRGPGAPAPKPTPKPPMPVTVLGVPDGGKLARQDVDGATVRYGLKNGLTIIIRERHSSPLIAINVCVKAGAIHETDETAGLARVVQRAILKGNATRGAAAIDREVARLGGVLTTTAAADQTSFNLIVPAESFDAAVELLAEMLLKPAFQPEEIARAAAEVELQQGRRSANEQAFDALYGAAFATSPLKRGSGLSASLGAAATRERALAFHQQFYQPQNVVISVVGDAFSIKALGQLQLQFGNFAKPAGASPAGPAAGEEPAQERLRYANLRVDVGQSLVTFGYRTPAIRTDREGLKEWAALQVLSATLGIGGGSRMGQGLREGQASRDKQSVAFETGAGFLALPGAGMIFTRMRVDSLRIDRAEAEYFREIERFRREIVSDGELQRARAFYEKRYLDTITRFEREAEVLGRYQAQFGDYRLFDSNLARIRAVTAQEVQQAAARYLGLQNTIVQELEPMSAPPRTFTPEKFAELAVTFENRAIQPIKPEEIKPAVALKTFPQGPERVQGAEGQNILVAAVPVPIRDYSVLRGPRAYVREDKSQPLISIGVFFQGGRLLEYQATSGTTELMLRSMLKSTTTRKGELIALELETYGGEMHIVNQPDYYGFTLDVLSRNAEAAIRLLIDIIENPFFDKTEIARERDLLLADQAASRDDPAARARELLWASLYPGFVSGPPHPYGLPNLGLPEVVKGLTDEKLDAWYAKTIKRQFPLVVLVGDTDGSSLVSRIFSEGLKRGDLEKALKANLPISPSAPEDRVDSRAWPVTSQSIGYRVMTNSLTGPNDHLALAMFARLAAAGRLAEELRDKQGLTDEVGLVFEQNIASGALFAQLTTAPANEPRAREAVLAALQAVAAAAPTDDEFEQGRNQAIGRYAIALQDHPSRAAEYARAILLGRKPTDVETQPDAIRTLKKTDIKRVAESVLKATPPGRGVVRGK
ncbi:MAG: pitrilysin family protein [Blastocatellia bacterium]|nr:pitrilysin family protein [Blastocatellia bacterium]